MGIERRTLLLAGAGLVLGGCASGKAEQRPEEKGEAAEKGVPPTEDLMREHGVLDRLLLIYEAQLDRLGAGIPAKAFGSTATLIRRFIEDYHEKQEEQSVFPVMEQTGPNGAALVQTLRAQHDAGRVVTARIQQLASGPGDAPSSIAEPVRAFIRMYRPHAAREETVLFPAFREVMSPENLAMLGEQFEAAEERMFGKDGFQKIVDEVASIEKELGIYDLAQFTPR